jgi:hypothetical protein
MREPLPDPAGAGIQVPGAAGPAKETQVPEFTGLSTVGRYEACSAAPPVRGR